jgi:hypothetical protein
MVPLRHRGDGAVVRGRWRVWRPLNTRLAQICSYSARNGMHRADELIA